MHSGMAKGISLAEATSNSKKIKLVALAIVELRESEGTYVTQFLKKKFHSIFLKAFQFNLKACLGLVLPNQYCHLKNCD